MSLVAASAAAVAAWNLDEASGTRDDAVASSDLTDNNTTGSNTGKFSNAADFNGSNEYLSAADSATLSVGVSHPFSVSFWLYLDALPGSNIAAAVEKYAGANVPGWSGGGSFGWSVGVNSSGKAYLAFRKDDSNYWSKTGGSTLSTATWYHIAFKYPQDGNAASLYLNGVAETLSDWLTAGSALSGITDSGLDFNVGRGNVFNSGYGASAGYIDGRIDDLVLMDSYGLSESESAEIYNSGTGVAFASWVPSGIAFDAASNSGYNTLDASYTWNHTCTGSDRYLVVGVAMLSVVGSSVSAVTFNGDALTYLGSIASVSGAVRTELWGMAAPDTGTHAIQVDLSAALDSVGLAASFTGVHQTYPTETAATATGVGGSATRSVVTVADNALVLGAIGTDDTSITSDDDHGNNVSGALGSGSLAYRVPRTPPGADSVTWDGVGTLATWSIVAIALRPVAAGVPFFPTTFPWPHDLIHSQAWQRANFF